MRGQCGGGCRLAAMAMVAVVALMDRLYFLHNVLHMYLLPGPCIPIHDAHTRTSALSHPITVCAVVHPACAVGFAASEQPALYKYECEKPLLKLTV